MLRFLAWVICIISILGGAFLVLAFGLAFGNDVTYQWMVAMITSFFTSFTLTQPLKVKYSSMYPENLI
jgi:hypothetical protein